MVRADRGVLKRFVQPDPDLLRDAGTVVGDINDGRISPAVALDPDRTVLLAFFDAVDHRVFHHRLEKEPGKHVPLLFMVILLQLLLQL